MTTVEVQQKEVSPSFEPGAYWIDQWGEDDSQCTPFILTRQAINSKKVEWVAISLTSGNRWKLMPQSSPEAAVAGLEPLLGRIIIEVS